jgi:hypothetical protein
MVQMIRFMFYSIATLYLSPEEAIKLGCVDKESYDDFRYSWCPELVWDCDPFTLRGRRKLHFAIAKDLPYIYVDPDLNFEPPDCDLYQYPIYRKLARYGPTILHWLVDVGSLDEEAVLLWAVRVKNKKLVKKLMINFCTSLSENTIVEMSTAGCFRKELKYIKDDSKVSLLYLL